MICVLEEWLEVFIDRITQIVKPFVPNMLRSILKSGATQIKNIKPTKFPLQPAMHDAIMRSLEQSEVLSGILKEDPRHFPEIEELKHYWGIVRGITQILEPYNRADKYFSWAYFQQKISQGLFDIHKDLFIIWVTITKRPRTILEIGCRTGKSIAVQLFVHPDPNKCTVFLIDPFIERGSPKVVRRNLEHLYIPTNNIYFFVGYSEDVFPLMMQAFPKLRFDYVLVDGSHRKEDALKDLQMVASFVRGGVILCLMTSVRMVQVLATG